MATTSPAVQAIVGDIQQQLRTVDWRSVASEAWTNIRAAGIAIIVILVVGFFILLALLITILVIQVQNLPSKSSL